MTINKGVYTARGFKKIPCGCIVLYSQQLEGSYQVYSIRCNVKIIVSIFTLHLCFLIVYFYVCRCVNFLLYKYIKSELYLFYMFLFTHTLNNVINIYVTLFVMTTLPIIIKLWKCIVRCIKDFGFLKCWKAPNLFLFS